MTKVTNGNDFSEQIIADQEAMSRMQDEGGGSRARDVDPVKILAATPARGEDRSPVIALFRDPASADAALKQLRTLGIVNENIAVASSDAVILSPANDPNTYRATGEARDGSEFEEPVLPDSFRVQSHRNTPAMPDSAGYDADFEADQYHHPLHQVMVSVQVGAQDRKQVRDLLVFLGAAS